MHGGAGVAPGGVAPGAVVAHGVGVAGGQFPFDAAAGGVGVPVAAVPGGGLPASGEGVVVHCKGGLGRAGTVAARLLLELIPDLDVSDAMREVRDVRAGAIESRAQERHLEGLCR